MNRYRALLIDPGQYPERPVQIFGQDYQELERWAGEVLKKAVSPDAFVSIYETSERQIKIMPKAKEATA